MYDLIDVLCIISGGYVVYAAVVMKTKGRIINNVILNKGKDESSIRDKEKFVCFLYGKLLFFGILIMLAGIMNFVNSYTMHSGAVTITACCLFGAAIVGYGIVVNIALKKYVD